MFSRDFLVRSNHQLKQGPTVQSMDFQQGALKIKVSLATFSDIIHQWNKVSEGFITMFLAFRHTTVVKPAHFARGFTFHVVGFYKYKMTTLCSVATNLMLMSISALVWILFYGYFYVSHALLTLTLQYCVSCKRSSLLCTRNRIV